MTLKICSCCKKQLQTKDCINIGRNDLGLWFNCKNCNSTMLLQKLDARFKIAPLKYGGFRIQERVSQGMFIEWPELFSNRSSASIYLNNFLNGVSK